MKTTRISTNQHTWITYLNPRNKKIRLDACSRCGVLKGISAQTQSCNDKTNRISKMLPEKGWIAERIVA